MARGPLVFFFLLLYENICCGYSEANEYHNILLCIITFLLKEAPYLELWIFVSSKGGCLEKTSLHI